MTATDLSRNAHVLVLKELRYRFTESGSPSRTAALDAAISTLAARQPVGQEPVLWVSPDVLDAMAIHRAQNFPAGGMGLACPAGSATVPLYLAPPAQAVDLPYSLDADPAGIRTSVCDVITGTLMVGAQGHTPPPAGHWAEPFWNAARADAAAQAVGPQAALLAEERAHGETIDQRDHYHEVADKLSGHIAAITGVDIGEHSSANCPWQNAIEAAEAYQPAQAVEMSPEFTDTARAAIAWVLWHHQGGSSPVGQPLRYSLGMGQHDRMSDHQITEAKRFAALSGATTEGFHHHKRAQGVDLTAVRVALDAAEGLAVACASVDCYSREEVAASGRAMKQQFADARALIDSQAVRNG